MLPVLGMDKCGCLSPKIRAAASSNPSGNTGLVQTCVKAKVDQLLQNECEIFLVVLYQKDCRSGSLLILTFCSERHTSFVWGTPAQQTVQASGDHLCCSREVLHLEIPLQWA